MIRRLFPLRDNPFKAEFAGVSKDGLAVAFHVLVETDARRAAPKTIIIAGGSVTQIAIDGTPTDLPIGVFKLGIGETIAVTY